MALFLVVLTLLLLSFALIGIKTVLHGAGFVKESASLHHSHEPADCRESSSSCSSCSTSRGCGFR